MEKIQEKTKKKCLNFSRSTVYLLISIIFAAGIMPLYYKFLEYQLWL